MNIPSLQEAARTVPSINGKNVRKKHYAHAHRDLSQKTGISEKTLSRWIAQAKEITE